jgi:two-component system, OmpR family, sensor kinase
MDGFKNFLNESLQRKLSVTLSLAILGVALVAGIFSFLSAFNEAYELQDDVLRQVAALMDRQHLVPEVLAGRGSREGNEESRVIVQRLGDARQAPLSVDAGPMACKRCQRRVRPSASLSERRLPANR